MPAFQADPNSLYSWIMGELRKRHGDRAVEVEPEVWRIALRQTNGNVHALSRWLGCTRSLIYLRLRKLGLNRELLQKE